jgi:RIO kinase 2
MNEIKPKKYTKLESEQGKEFINELYTKFEEELNILGISCHIAVLKLARLGRTSFRAVKTKRDYVKYKTHYNWLYLSRISATNEFKFLKGLYQVGFPVPKPYDQNRHGILMQYIPSYPLSRVDDLGDKEKAYNELTSIIEKMASKGLIHGDFNEFNILVNFKDQRMIIIDFP